MVEVEHVVLAVDAQRDAGAVAQVWAWAWAWAWAFGWACLFGRDRGLP
ncbi:hypothetical protein [Streptomyces sp. ISL-86]|nr:hypothetical protein [Streptomyces sp. ISL-86]MBT2455786.1 hypothetical protein [Streptomyces sp. ISL-86]